MGAVQQYTVPIGCVQDDLLKMGRGPVGSVPLYIHYEGGWTRMDSTQEIDPSDPFVLVDGAYSGASNKKFDEVKKQAELWKQEQQHCFSNQRLEKKPEGKKRKRM